MEENKTDETKVKRQLSISIDGLRRSLGQSYNTLVKILQENTYDGGEITVHTEDVQSAMDDLRQSIGFLYCIYMPNEEKFSDMSDDSDGILWFNPEDESEETESK